MDSPNKVPFIMSEDEKRTISVSAVKISIVTMATILISSIAMTWSIGRQVDVTVESAIEKAVTRAESHTNSVFERLDERWQDRETRMHKEIAEIKLRIDNRVEVRILALEEKTQTHATQIKEGVLPVASTKLTALERDIAHIVKQLEEMNNRINSIPAKQE